ncbi:putative type II restriction enzyme methylase subunit (plasmid) [Rhodovulum sp. P5]|uniref:Eco57I restriction-modification methylase domain-containing protein n=1 Tax=Rhodovulum sp. P5 TaxID=1564506 RepID=UPI0009C33236|nr:Eco57I restriction-modification methylase domain-containing protein [Rhodovulum sp. P5]ARE42477.1 putative type II restriction enzyme methylase subunit [Rhodovulum sp. P5]
MPKLRDPAETLRVVEARDFGGDLLLKEVQQRIVAVLRMAEALSPKYHAVVANPPYMGNGGMNSKLQGFAKAAFPDSKSDLYAIFMERSVKLARKSGIVSMINMQSWMFLPYFEALRSKLFSNTHVLTMAHLGPRAFDSIGGDVVSTTAFCIQNSRKMDHLAQFIRLVDGRDEEAKSTALLAVASGRSEKNKYFASQNQIEHLPGNLWPIG